MINRKTPTSRLIRKIGLADFPNKAPLEDCLPNVQNVVLPLRQHIGVAAIPVVRAGDRVQTGQVVAKRPVHDGKPALGADIHASIAGTITEVSQEFIRISD
jgi:Na+-translocating ferredoxin:NAD+ oxidoreductase RnfC subunit